MAFINFPYAESWIPFAGGDFQSISTQLPHYQNGSWSLISLNLNLSSGGTLNFSSTKTTVTINGSDGSGTSLSGALSIAGFAWMLLAVAFSMEAMVQDQGNIVKEAADHPLVEKLWLSSESVPRHTSG